MREHERGRIVNEARASQQQDMSGLRFGNITGTDRDGGFDYHGKAFVHWELKYLNPKLPRGQELYIERLNDALERSVPSIYIIAVHEVHDSSIHIQTAECKVICFRRNKIWNYPECESTIKDIVSAFIHDIEPLDTNELWERVLSSDKTDTKQKSLDEAMFPKLPKLTQEEEVF